MARWVKDFKDGREDVKDKPRPGAPITAATPQNNELVSRLIQKDPHVSYDDIEEETSISRGTVFHIIHEILGLRKLGARWVPHKLNEKNKQERVEACKENLALIKSGQLRLCDILTCDETWFYYRQIGRKSSKSCWVAAGQTPSIVVRRGCCS